MKRSVLLLMTVFILSLKGYSQFITFKPYISNPPTRSIPSSPNNAEIQRVSGYVLDETGNVKERIPLKVSIVPGLNGETVTINSYYSASTGFIGGGWQNVSIGAHAIGNMIPTTKVEQVAFANFDYWANLMGKKIWFRF